MGLGVLLYMLGPTGFRGFAATFRRSSGVIVTRRRLPPWRPMADMFADKSEGFVGLSGTINSAGGSMVERSTIHLASWFGSRGRLPFPTVMNFCSVWDCVLDVIFPYSNSADLAMSVSAYSINLSAVVRSRSASRRSCSDVGLS